MALPAASIPYRIGVPPFLFSLYNQHIRGVAPILKIVILATSNPEFQGGGTQIIRRE